MSLQIIDRFRPGERRKQQAAVDAGRIFVCDEFEALDEQQLKPLALFSGSLLLVGLLFFPLLNLIVYLGREARSAVSFSLGAIVLCLIINILGYILILPIHEGIHALAFLFWGGRPYFGAKWPLALFCGAREQIFPRNYYLVIGLAPLLVISVGAMLFTFWYPELGIYTILASAGNLAGAAGDLWTVKRLGKLEAAVLVEDTEAGYRAWRIEVSQ